MIDFRIVPCARPGMCLHLWYNKRADGRAVKLYNIGSAHAASQAWRFEGAPAKGDTAARAGRLVKIRFVELDDHIRKAADVASFCVRVEQKTGSVHLWAISVQSTDVEQQFRYDPGTGLFIWRADPSLC